MKGDSGVAGEGRVVGIPKFHSWGKFTMPLTNTNSDWMSNASSGLCIIYIVIYLFIYIYIWYVRIPYIHPAPFVRDAIFPHCMLVHVTTVAQEKRLAGQKD